MVQFNQDASTIPNAAVTKVIDAAESFDRPGYQIALGGGPIGNVITAAPGPSEGAGILAAMMIMLIAFGSVVAMGLPIMTALFGIADRLRPRGPAQPPAERPGLRARDVGHDRPRGGHRLRAVHRHPLPAGFVRGPRARAQAVIDLAGHLGSGRALRRHHRGHLAAWACSCSSCPFLQGLAVGTIAAVLLVMAAALTLLPAMLGFAGRAIDRHARAQASPDRRHPGTGQLLVPLEPDDPAAGLGVGGAGPDGAVALAIPLFSMRLAFTDAGNDPTSLTTRQAFDLLAEGFGPGFNGPLVVAAPLSSAGRRGATMQRVDAALRADPRHRLRRPGRGQRRSQRRSDRRLPDHLAPGGPDLRARHPAAARR